MFTIQLKLPRSFHFDFNDDQLSEKWQNWLELYNNYKIACGLNEEKFSDERKIAILLNIAGEKVLKLYINHKEVSDDEETAIQKLTKLFSVERSSFTNSSEESNQSSSSSIHETCRACGKEYPHRGDCPAKNRQCDICGVRGHFKACCNRALDFRKSYKYSPSNSIERKERHFNQSKKSKVKPYTYDDFIF